MIRLVAHHEAWLIVEYSVLASGGVLWAVASWVRRVRRR